MSVCQLTGIKRLRLLHQEKSATLFLKLKELETDSFKPKIKIHSKRDHELVWHHPFKNGKTHQEKGALMDTFLMQSDLTWLKPAT